VNFVEVVAIGPWSSMYSNFALRNFVNFKITVGSASFAD